MQAICDSPDIAELVEDSEAERASTAFLDRLLRSRMDAAVRLSREEAEDMAECWEI